MRANLDSFLSAYERPARPDTITQQPLDGDADHYERLCNLTVDDLTAGELPSAWDFGTYADDIAYMETVQPELFVYLLPACLAAWRHDQMADEVSDYTGAAEVFTGALARRPLLKDCVQPAQAEAVRVFMGDTLLDRIDRQHVLSFPGKDRPAFLWILSLNTYAMLFPTLHALWTSWWEFNTPGQAVAALQYASLLMYDDHTNPILAAPRRHQLHAPAVELWAPDSQVLDESWKLENIVFLMETLTPAYMRDALERAAQTLAGIHDRPIPLQMLADFEAQKPLLEHRLSELPDILSLPNRIGSQWSPLL